MSSSISIENISYSNWPCFAWEDNVGTDNCTFVIESILSFSILLNVSERGMAVSLGKKSMENLQDVGGSKVGGGVKYQI